jgi:hypothetical protein
VLVKQLFIETLETAVGVAVATSTKPPLVDAKLKFALSDAAVNTCPAV